MTDLVVRKLLIDLATPFPARWNGGDAFRSAYFSALSMSFPVGEQYFIDSVRAGIKALPQQAQEPMRSEVQNFVGQEATHRRIHGLFNGHLTTMGFVNALEVRAAKRVRANAHRDVRVHVGATAATEHLTAVFADWMLRHPEALEGAEPRLQTLWLWHSAEESEHRSTAFDMYRALKGSEKWRLRLFRYITITFLADVTRQTVRNPPMPAEMTQTTPTRVRRPVPAPVMLPPNGRPMRPPATKAKKRNNAVQSGFTSTSGLH